MTTTTTQKTDREIDLRCKAFFGTPIQFNRLLVSVDGTVRVYDRVAGHYTTCHSLSTSALRRARALATDS